jgi:hypothetical protein
VCEFTLIFSKIEFASIPRFEKEGEKSVRQHEGLPAQQNLKKK